MRIVEISSNGKYLHVERGFLAIRYGDERIARVPLDDIAGVIANSNQLTYSNNLLIELAERAIPLVVCGKNHTPVSILWPTESNYEQSARLQLQINCSLPRKKSAWRQVVRAKLLNQASALALCGQNPIAIERLSKLVKPGDPENLEAQAARRYWPALLGANFRRDQDAEGVNSLLNYGYAIMRSSVARAILAIGLHPGLGLHHHSSRNAMPLVDDLMEPFRPIVDLRVRDLIKNSSPAIVEPDNKRMLASLLFEDYLLDGFTHPLSEVILKSARSYLEYLRGDLKQLIFVSPKNKCETFSEPKGDLD